MSELERAKIKEEIDMIIDSMEEGSSFMDNADKYDQIHNLEMKLNGIKPMNTEIECIGCGS